MKRTTLPLFLLILAMVSCTGKKSRLDHFASEQEKKEKIKTAYNQAELDFWASVYEPTLEDLSGIREAWVDYSQAFPESKAFLEIENQTRKTNQKVVIVSLFTTNYEIADLKDKSLGWSTYPVARTVTELSENDLVLKALMPVHNPWARFYLLQIPIREWDGAASFVVSNRTSKLEFPK